MNPIEALKAEALEITRDELKIAVAKIVKTKSPREIYGSFLSFQSRAISRGRLRKIPKIISGSYTRHRCLAANRIKRLIFSRTIINFAARKYSDKEFNLSHR